MPGHLALVLHAHLPYVRHPEHEEFLEEDWFYEAITETYLPLLLVFERLAEEGVPFRVTMTMTPPLISMLRDELLVARYERHINKLVELAEKEVVRNQNHGHLTYLANYYLDHFKKLRTAFVDHYKRDLVSAFKRLQDHGVIEIITCGATHGFLPLMQQYPEAVRAQISVAASHYRLTFGRDPKGIWLPECGYYPGVEKFLAAEGIRYFFVDTHGLLDATPRPRFGCYAPLFTASGVAAFARDPESSQQVWSQETGYPGDPMYREFYRDIGWDLDFEYIKKYVQPTGHRKNTGIKYHRITGRGLDLNKKAYYDPHHATERAAAHAANFVQNRVLQFQHLMSVMGTKDPVVVAPYDAELYGHWWFEGPQFIDFMIRRSVYDQNVYRLSTPTDYLRDSPENQVATPPMCSWGANGYAAVWLDSSNDWIYRHLHQCAKQMIELARANPDSEGLQRRALNQAARELLLAQSSDWAFIMNTGTMVEYARRRTREHVLRFNRLADQLRRGQVDESWLSMVEGRDNIFPELDYRVYRPQ